MAKIKTKGSESYRLDTSSIRESLRKRKIVRVRGFLNILIAVSTGLTLLLSFIMAFSLSDELYLNKKDLQKNIVNIVNNDGDLRAIKQLFSNHPKTTKLAQTFSSESSFYPKTIALSSVLDDIRVQAFINDQKELLPKLEPLIKEYEEINPFDKLRTGQKDYFENIRIKTGDTYPRIRNDVNNLVDELHQKNLLVSEYLSDSKMSFWISIVAVFLSLMIGGYQIFTSRPDALRKALIGPIDNSINDNDDTSKQNKQSVVNNSPP